MLEFKRLCDRFENMSSAERGLLLTQKSVAVLSRLKRLTASQRDPATVLAGFIIGSVF